MMKTAVYSRRDGRPDMLYRYIRCAADRNGYPVEIRLYDSLDILKWDLDISLEYDVVIVDGDWNAGVEIRKRYVSLNLVVIADNMSEEMYDAQPCYILGYPLNCENTGKILTCIWERAARGHVFAFSSGRVKHRVDVRDILYFANDKRMINVVTLDGQHSFYGSMRELECQIKEMSSEFVRIHESYMVNMNHVKEMYSDRLVMRDGADMDISVSRRAEVKRRYAVFHSRLTYI